MRNLKKVLSLTLALVMLLGMMVVGAGAVETNFPDDAKIGDKYREAVAVMEALNIFQGDSQGNLNPQGILDRASAAKLITMMMIGESASKGFAEIKTSAFFSDMKNHWAAGYVDYCASVGIVEGSNGMFNPDTKLTGAMFATMLLRASGAADITGAGWKAQAIAAAAQFGIEDVTDAQLTREAAAKMTLEGLLVSPSGEKAYKVGDETFTSAADAYFYAQGQSPAGTVTLTTAKDSLAAKNFKLTKDSDEDDFGRPANAWKVDGKEIVEVVSSEPVKTYTEAVNEKTIFADLGVTGIKGSSDSYVVMDEVWYDGLLVNKAARYSSNDTQYGAPYDGSEMLNSSGGTIANTEAAAKAYVGAAYNSGFNNNIAITKTSNDNLAGSGNGATVEIYATGTANHYIMVIVHEYAAKIDSVTKATSTAARKVTFAANVTNATGGDFKTYETEEFDKGDVVLVTICKNEIVNMKLAQKVENVAVTGYKTGASVTAGGTTYKYSAHMGTIPAYSMGTTTTYNFYLDSCGNVIIAETYSDAPTADVYVFVTALDSTDQGDITTGVYKNVKYIALDGTTAFAKVDTNSAPTAGTWCTITDDNDHEGFKTFTAVTETMATTGVSLGSTATNKQGLSSTKPDVANGVVANNKTLFILKTGATEYKPYIGLANVPGYQDKNASDSTDTKVLAIIGSDGFASGIYVDVSTVVGGVAVFESTTATTDVGDVVYLFSGESNEVRYDEETKTSYKVYPVVKDGVVTEIKATESATLTNRGLVTLTYNSNGYVTKSNNRSADRTQNLVTVNGNGKIAWSEPVLNLSTRGADTPAVVAAKAVYTVSVAGKGQTDLETAKIDDVTVGWDSKGLADTMAAFVETYNGTAGKSYIASYATNTLTLTAKNTGAVATAPKTDVSGTEANMTEATQGKDAAAAVANYTVAASWILADDVVVYVINTTDKSVEVVEADALETLNSDSATGTVNGFNNAAGAVKAIYYVK